MCQPKARSRFLHNRLSVLSLLIVIWISLPAFFERPGFFEPTRALSEGTVRLQPDAMRSCVDDILLRIDDSAKIHLEDVDPWWSQQVRIAWWLKNFRQTEDSHEAATLVVRALRLGSTQTEENMCGNLRVCPRFG